MSGTEFHPTAAWFIADWDTARPQFQFSRNRRHSFINVRNAARVKCIQPFDYPLTDKGRRLYAEVRSNLSKPSEPRYRNPHRVHLGWVRSASASTLAGCRRNLAAFLGISACPRFGGLAGEHVPHTLAHWPSSYCLISDGLAAQAVAPHHRVLGGWSFGATMTVTTKPAAGEDPVTLTVSPDLLPAERTQRRSSWQASVANSVATSGSLVPFRADRRPGSCSSISDQSMSSNTRSPYGTPS